MSFIRAEQLIPCSISPHLPRNRPQAGTRVTHFRFYSGAVLWECGGVCLTINTAGDSKLPPSGQPSNQTGLTAPPIWPLFSPLFSLSVKLLLAPSVPKYRLCKRSVSLTAYRPGSPPISFNKSLSYHHAK